MQWTVIRMAITTVWKSGKYEFEYNIIFLKQCSFSLGLSLSGTNWVLTINTVSCIPFFNMYPCYKGSSLLGYKNQIITEICCLRWLSLLINNLQWFIITFKKDFYPKHKPWHSRPCHNFSHLHYMKSVFTKPIWSPLYP